MRKTPLLIVALCIVSLAIAGCTQKAADSSSAIKQADAMQTVDQKVDYLVKQANAFVSSKEFDEAVKTAKYILGNLDKDSQAAKDIIAKAQAELKKVAESAVADVKGKIGSFGK